MNGLTMKAPVIKSISRNEKTAIFSDAYHICCENNQQIQCLAKLTEQFWVYIGRL